MFPEVCNACAAYDWGHWHIKRVVQWGFIVGVFVALYYATQPSSGREPGIALLVFWLILGGIVGAAAADAIASAMFNRFLMKAPVPGEERVRRQEAEKFFYLGLLSAFQGKERYALRMLRLARRHGWERWERLTNDPSFAAFCELPQVREVVS